MKKGVIFSLSVLLLLLSFIFLQQSTLKTNLQKNSFMQTINAFQMLNNHYNNLSHTLLELETTNDFGQMQERFLPFQHETDKNTLTLHFNLPIKSGTLVKYFDSINALEAFAEDTNYSNYYTGIQTQISTTQNNLWGGTQTSLNFVTEPDCAKIEAKETGIDISKAWCGSFTLNSTQRIDANITISFPQEDLNSINCNWNGTENCPNDNFDPLNQNPYFNLQIIDQNCTECGFLNKEAKGHFDASQQNWIAISCNGTNCTSGQIDINLTEIFALNRASTAVPAKADMATTFKNKITKFYFNDLNITATSPDYNITMVTKK